VGEKPVRGPVLVTGSGGGIGGAIAQRLAERGFRVYAGLRTQAAVAAFPRQAGGRIVPILLDVADEANVESAARAITSEAGAEGLSGLVNSAGIIVDGPLELIPVENFRRQFEVNVTGPFAVTRALLPALRRGRGRVVNIGAVSARMTPPFFGPIAASKAALASLTDAMRMEFAPFGIEVALIEPGGIQTGIWGAAVEMQSEGFKSQAPEMVELYRPALQAMREAFARFGADRPDVVVDAVLAALLSIGKPKPRVLVGKGTSQMAFLGRLPIRMRDRMLMSSLGIAKALKPAAERLLRGKSAIA
jgi:NAD(P)-dependent dehydrogenase (short-subunit alcohol dehydrogenase family)